MAIKIYYDVSQSDAGSPWWASHREFDRVADNVTASSSEVEDDADSSEWETPCAQNNVDGYVLISGPHDYYDVIVTVAGTATDIGQKTGTGRVSGGLGWRFTDHNYVPFASGIHAAGSTTGAGTPQAVSAPFPRRIPNNKKVLACSCTVNGGIQIAPNPGNFYVSTKTLLTMTWSIAFVLAWSHIDVPSGGGVISVPIPFPVGSDVTSGPLSYWELLGENVGAVTGAFRSALAPSGPAKLVRMAEDFQDPELKRQVGEAAQILEDPDVKRKLEQAIERQSKSGRHRGS